MQVETFSDSRFNTLLEQISKSSGTLNLVDIQLDNRPYILRCDSDQKFEGPLHIIATD